MQLECNAFTAVLTGHSKKGINILMKTNTEKLVLLIWRFNGTFHDVFMTLFMTFYDVFNDAFHDVLNDAFHDVFNNSFLEAKP